MLTALNLIQLVIYIALLALLGQGVLYVLAGAKRQNNFFYQLLELISKPFTVPVRKRTPAKVADRHVSIVSFFVLLVIYAVVNFEKISLCVASNMAGCK